MRPGHAAAVLAAFEFAPAAAPVHVVSDAKWSRIARDALDVCESSTDIKVAVGDLVVAVETAVKGYIGDVPGILSALRSATISFGWGSKDSTTSKQLVQFESSVFMQLTLTKEDTSKKVSMFGSAVTHTLRIRGQLVTMKAENDAAHHKCEDMMQGNADDLSAALEAMHIFK